MVHVKVHFLPVQATNHSALGLSTMPSVNSLEEQIYVTLDLPYGASGKP